MVDIILAVIAAAGIYFTFRYVSLLYAFGKIEKEMQEIRKDLTQNQMLHLPVPNRSLAKVMSEFNITLEEIQKERQKYEKREKEFQKQIENISHDLRTPLTVILGYLKFSRNKQHLIQNGELKETLEIIERKAETMRNLVNQFYEFSRINAGDYKMEIDRVDISRILREALVGNYQILEQSRLKVDIDLPEHPIWVNGETAGLERIFLNLMQNAGRYAAGYFSVSVEEKEKNVKINFVNDTDQLSEEDISHVFERFYVQEPSRNQGGTGLGLTVAKLLAEEMGGSLSVRLAGSDKSQVCFELCMPVIKKGPGCE